MLESPDRSGKSSTPARGGNTNQAEGNELFLWYAITWKYWFFTFGLIAKRFESSVKIHWRHILKYNNFPKLIASQFDSHSYFATLRIHIENLGTLKSPFG